MHHDIAHGDDAYEFVSVGHWQMANTQRTHHLRRRRKSILRRARYDLVRHKSRYRERMEFSSMRRDAISHISFGNDSKQRFSIIADSHRADLPLLKPPG